MLLYSEDRSASLDHVTNNNNDSKTSVSQVTGILSDVSEVCDDGNAKTFSSQQWRESEEEVGHKKVDLSKDILIQRDLGDNSKDGMDGGPDALSVPNNGPNGLHKKDMVYYYTRSIFALTAI